MTTGESTDNVEVMDNVTITSDAAYERVTSDEHFEEDGERGYLQQNTSGLVQEIPNIAFIDIADTMLESKKTLYNRENWILRVGKAGRSIETQPQDTISLLLDEDKTYIISPGYTDNYIEFDRYESSSHFTTCKPDNTYLANIYTIDILQSGYYIISYGWELNANSATWYKITVGKLGVNPGVIMTDRYKDTSCPEIMSGGKYMSNIFLEKGDSIYMKIQADDAIKIYKTTYLNIQFQQYNI